MIYYNESGYLQLLQNILEHGVDTPDRTGVGCRKLFNQQLRFNINNGWTFPLMTARQTPLRFAFEEFWLFLRGLTDTKILEEKNINIWKGNTSREFLDDRGMTGYPEGNLGKSYSYQYRNFGGSGVDQVRDVIDGIKRDPFGRRHLISIWNPADADEMPLLPCLFAHLFYVTPTRSGSNRLNIKVFIRSWDVLFGGPFNIAQMGLWLLAVSKATGMMAGDMVVDATDAHVYRNQFAYAMELVTRDINKSPTVTIGRYLENLDDILKVEYSDIGVSGFQLNETPFKTPKPPMAV